MKVKRHDNGSYEIFDENGGTVVYADVDRLVLLYAADLMKLLQLRSSISKAIMVIEQQPDDVNNAEVLDKVKAILKGCE